jgi:hypothetical protein
MTGSYEEYQSLIAGEGATCQVTYVSNGVAPVPGIPVEHREDLEEEARAFLRESGGDVCVLVAGALQSEFSDQEHSTESAVAERCQAALGDPGGQKDLTIDLILDTLGGSLDSAFRTVLFLSRFTSHLRVYVPRRAKSAGTLIAIGGQEIHLAPLAELGPLDTQIPDPRNPTEKVSALDCFQSVDYVRGFGIDTLRQVLISLGKEMKTGIPLSELVHTATEFANSCTETMLARISALDFGGWGRTLQIGERYARLLLSRAGYDDAEAISISHRLVYEYTHHPFPIDITEASSIGLRAGVMSPTLSRLALSMVHECAGLDIAVGVWRASTAAAGAPDSAGKPATRTARTRKTPRAVAHGHDLVPPQGAVVDPFRDPLSIQEQTPGREESAR